MPRILLMLCLGEVVRRDDAAHSRVEAAHLKSGIANYSQSGSMPTQPAAAYLMSAQGG
jgi:hypothetical protein